VESCSLVVEHDDGRLEIIHWATLAAKTRHAPQENETEASLEAEAA
jgi:hypothetical protein